MREFWKEVKRHLFGTKKEDGNQPIGKLEDEEIDNKIKSILDYYDNLDITESNIATLKPPKEMGDIQKQIAEWSNRGLTYTELDDKISKHLGEPVEVKLVPLHGQIFEEKTWIIGLGGLSRHRLVGPEEVNQKIMEKLNEISPMDNPEFQREDFDDMLAPKPKKEPKKPETLEEKLQAAIDNEEFEEACRLRDIIKNDK